VSALQQQAPAFNWTITVSENKGIFDSSLADNFDVIVFPSTNIASLDASQESFFQVSCTILTFKRALSKAEKDL
jgi:hypothetical protein